MVYVHIIYIVYLYIHLYTFIDSIYVHWIIKTWNTHIQRAGGIRNCGAPKWPPVNGQNMFFENPAGAWIMVVVYISIYIYTYIIYIYNYIYIYIWYDIACIYCISEKHQSTSPGEKLTPSCACAQSLGVFYKQDDKNKDTPPNTTELWFYTKKIWIPWCVIIVPFHLQLFWVRCRAFRLLQAQHSPAPCDPWPGASKHEPSRSRTWWTSPSWPNLVTENRWSKFRTTPHLPSEWREDRKNMWCMMYIIYDLHDPMIENTWDVPNKCQQSCGSAAYTWVWRETTDESRWPGPPQLQQTLQ